MSASLRSASIVNRPAAKIFDVLVLGSGPAAVAALDALDPALRTGVVTGETSAPPRGALHPKILSVARARGEPAGVTDALTAPGRRRPLFASAIAGGLANYWGQQFVRLSRGDPWPREVFAGHEDYVAECMAVERLFRIEGGEPVQVAIDDAGDALHVPRLLTGTRDAPDAGLFTMARVFHRLAARCGATVLRGRALDMRASGGTWRILLDDGRTFAARRIILAAGAIGNALLLLRSFPELTAARIADHTPHLVYATGLGAWRAARPATAPAHFNMLTYERHVGDRVGLFASLYDMARADVNLIMASLTGYCLPLGGERPAPHLASLVTPVQIWTPGTIGHFVIERHDDAVVLRDEAFRTDATGIDALLDALRQAGARLFGGSRTPPGEGFHYHGLQLRSGSQPALGVARFLRHRTGDGIICVDASVLGTIGCRPPTLSAMATARRITTGLNPQVTEAPALVPGAEGRHDHVRERG